MLILVKYKILFYLTCLNNFCVAMFNNKFLNKLPNLAFMISFRYNYVQFKLHLYILHNLSIKFTI